MMHHANQFQILGTLEVVRRDQVVPVSAAKHRILLATLLLRANQLVSISTLVDNLWDSEPPARAKNTVQAYVTRLRRVLGRGVIRTEGTGYLINTDGDALDLARFDRLLAEAGAATRRGDSVAEADLLHEAVGLWRGQLLANVPSERIHAVDVPALTERRLHAVARWIDVAIRLGRHTELASELRALTAEYPLREQFWQQLMLVLYRSGRQAEALDVYQRVTTLLGDELGLHPSAELEALQRAILVQDPSLAAPRAVQVSATPPAESGWVVQRQLPADVRGFVGRTEQVEAICATLAGEEGGAVPIAAVSGSPGIGKTALAVHVAHRLSGHFPDGLWYVPLGDTCAATPDLDRILTELLRASGMDCSGLPDHTQALSAALRSRLAGRRVLLVLDDARDANQVLPLLPGTAGSAVLVTSRRELSGLIAFHGARCHTLGLLDPMEATTLLADVLGTERGRAEAADLAELARLCGFLPLALRIAAANLVGSPAGSIAGYNATLAAEGRLGMFAVRGGDCTVRASFDVSYGRLSPGAARLFRLMSHLPDGSNGIAVAAAVVGEDVAVVAGLLQELTDANLISHPAPDRYQFQDLLRLYAVERGRAEDTEADRAAARQRVHGYYSANGIATRVVHKETVRRMRSGAPGPGSRIVALPAQRRDHGDHLVRVDETSTKRQRNIRPGSA